MTRALIPVFRDPAMTFSDLAKKYVKWLGQYQGASEHTVTEYERVYGMFVTHLRREGLTDDVRHFNPDTVESFAEALAAAGGKASTVNNRLSVLSSLGNYGTQTRDGRGKYILAENPVVRVRRPKAQTPREKYLLLEEMRALLAVQLPAHERLVVDLVADTALRASELAEAKVRDLLVDGDRVVLQVTVKGGRPREIPLGKAVAGRLLQSLRFRDVDQDDPLLVNAKGGAYDRKTLSNTVARATRRAGIERLAVRAHVLRKTFATLALEAGVDIPTIADMLNHANTQTVQRYAFVRTGRADDARERVRQMLNGQITQLELTYSGPALQAG